MEDERVMDEERKGWCEAGTQETEGMAEGGRERGKGAGEAEEMDEGRNVRKRDRVKGMREERKPE